MRDFRAVLTVALAIVVMMAGSIPAWWLMLALAPYSLALFCIIGFAWLAGYSIAFFHLVDWFDRVLPRMPRRD